MAGERRGEETVIVPTDRLELSEFQDGQQILIHLSDASMFHAIIVDPEAGVAVVRPWVGGGQANAGSGDEKSIVGTRKFEGSAESHTELAADQEVEWGGLTFDDELVLKSDEGGDNILFTGQSVVFVQA